MAMKVYVDRMSQPSRAVLIFCKVNGIDYEEILVDISKQKQFAPEYKGFTTILIDLCLFR
ncbi:putative glutathione transferase [Helianthus debilis subsp. tardiflorus]